MNAYENGLHSEIIDIDNEDRECDELANSAYPVQGAAGGFVTRKPMICGGFNENPLTGGSNKCFILGEDQPITMAYERSYPASISISSDEVSHFLARHFGCRAQDPTLDISPNFVKKSIFLLF